jgi:hypothetical protein
MTFAEEIQAGNILIKVIQKKALFTKNALL